MKFFAESFLLFFLPITAVANPYGFYPSTLKLSIESSYYNTKVDYDSGGNSINLPSGNQVTEYRFNFGGAYDLNDWLGVFAKVTFNREDAITSTLERTNTGLSEGLVGVDFLAWSKFVKIVPEISSIIPASPAPDPTSTTTSSSALLGNGVFGVSGKLNVTKKFGHFGFWGFGGYTYLANGFSAYIPYGLDLRLDLASFFTDLGMNGIASMNTDQYTSNPSFRQQVTSLIEGGSLLYGAVNPAWTNLVANIGVKFASNYSAALGIEQPLMGQNTSEGTRILLTLSFNSSPAGLYRNEKRRAYNGDDSESLSPDDDTGFQVDTNQEDSSVKPPKKAKPAPQN